MIRDLSQTLRSLLTQPGVPAELAAAQIVFDRPTDQFNPTQATVDLFLYDIRENLELRDNEAHLERQNGQVTIRRPPLRVACSYLVTAWSAGVSGDELALQEHRLLSQVLQVFSRYSTIPNQFLQGSLANQEPPLPMMTAQANGLKEPAEFWTSLGTQLRASIGVTVTISIETLVTPEVAPIVITRDLRLGQRISPQLEQFNPGTEEQFFRIGGRISDAADQPVAKATVTLVEVGLTTATDEEGYYSIGVVPAGTYTLQVQSGAMVEQTAIAIPVVTTDGDYNLQLSS
jgi:hypothetical protein